MDLAGITFSDFAIKVLPAKTPQNEIVCLLHFPEHSARETEGRVYTDDLENTLGYAFLQACYLGSHIPATVLTLYVVYLDGVRPWSGEFFLHSVAM